MIINYAAIKRGLAQGIPGSGIIEGIKQSMVNDKEITETPVKNDVTGPAKDKLWNDIFEDLYKNSIIEVKPLRLPLNTLFKKNTMMEAGNG